MPVITNRIPESSSDADAFDSNRNGGLLAPSAIELSAIIWLCLPAESGQLLPVAVASSSFPGANVPPSQPPQHQDWSLILDKLFSTLTTRLKDQKPRRCSPFVTDAFFENISLPSTPRTSLPHGRLSSTPPLELLSSAVKINRERKP